MSDELKSAWELALEKLEKSDPGGGAGSLSEDQKRRIAEVRAEAKAKRAELDVLHASRLADARSSGDAEALLRLEAERDETLRRVAEREDGRVAEIRAESEA